MRVMYAVKETIADVSSVSPSTAIKCLFHGVHCPHQHTVDTLKFAIGEL